MRQERSLQVLPEKPAGNKSAGITKKVLFPLFFTAVEMKRQVHPGSCCIIKKEEETTMQKYECEPCGYIYDPAEGDPDNGIEPGTAFEDLPDDWVCPICGAEKSDFKPVED